MSKITKSSQKTQHKDHFVPQVYLRRFIDKNINKLHVYDRQEDKWFETPTKNICFEYGWDQLDTEGKDSYFSNHLKALEPCLKQFLEGFKQGAISTKDRYYFSMWLAIIFALSPKREAYDQLSLMLLGQNAIQDSSELKFSLKKRNLQQAQQIAKLIYAYDWHLTYNFSEIPFITCDFPMHYLCLNDTISPMYQPLGIVLDPHTFLRINPKQVTQPEAYQLGFNDFNKIQSGTITRGQISKHWKGSRKLVSKINEQSIFNAERFIISSYIDNGLKQFVKNRKNKTTSFKPELIQTQTGPAIQTKLVNNFENVPILITKKLIQQLAES